LRSSRNAFKDDIVLTLDGREFQAHAAATGKARSPIVDWRVDGTVSVDVLGDRSQWFFLENLQTCGAWLNLE